MLLTNQHPLNKSLFISLIGIPNSGKSTLMNKLIGMELAAVSPKEQMTRNRYKGVVTIGNTQLIFSDTPGIHHSKKEMNKRMQEQAIECVGSAELILALVDLGKNIKVQIEKIKAIIKDSDKEVWCVFTKVDLMDGNSSFSEDELRQYVGEMAPEINQFFFISAILERNTNDLRDVLVKKANPGSHLYLDGSISDKNERFFVCEYIREQVFELLSQELPYECAVVIDSFSDERVYEKKRSEYDEIFHPIEKESVPQKSSDKDKSRYKIVAKIEATVLVNRPGQRAIVIGTKGSMIREIGQRSRHKIEKLLGGPVFLKLHVKITPKWFQRNDILNELDLPRAMNSTRVWRAST